jgi:phosphate transport system substrate-binding protein
MANKIVVFLLMSISLNLFAAQKINGAGATFPYPLYSKWFSEYSKAHAGIEFNYQSIGSGGGIKQVLAQTVDFGATDAPMTDDELKQAKTPIHHIPTVLGAVVVAYNVKGVETGLKLDGETIGKIFLGTITKWNDAAIAKLNPKAKLPATDILVVRRSDGSGTSFVYTTFLAATSAEFKTKVGAGKNVTWPAGIGAKGNEGVTALISQTDGAIGYVELAFANQNKLSMASVKNLKGEFVKPSVEAISKAAANVKDTTGDLRISVINSDAKGAYPISSFTWILLPEDKNSAALKEVRTFLGWAMKEGQQMAATLDYAPLPKKLAEGLIKKVK